MDRVKGEYGLCSSGGRYRVVGIDTSILPEESVRYRYQSGIEQTSIPNIIISPAQTEYRLWACSGELSLCLVCSHLMTAK